MKTEDDILDDMYRHLKQSPLMSAVSGTLCKEERITGSEGEDIVISVLTEVPGSQVEEVYVNVNIYVADLLRNRQYVKDTVRTRELSKIASESFNTKNGSNYRISLSSQKSFKVNGREEHCINNKVLYQFCNE